jgi:glycosyltransferase involved in cell wall biosynthesis
VSESRADQPAISVALCIHNGARFIEDQLQSILEQTYLPRQIVLSDDDSTDSTVELAMGAISRFLTAHPQVELDLVVLRNSPALGVAKNFERAILACTSELIALSDQDDVWHPNRLEEAAKTFVRRPEVSLLHTNARLVDDDGHSLDITLFEALGVTAWERRTVTKGDAINVLVRRNLVTGATTILRREIVPFAFPVPPGWIHDEWLGVIAAAIGRIDIDPRPLIDYRQHAGNQIGAQKPDFRAKVSKLREPRTERNRNLFIRARELVLRLEELGDRVDSRTLRIAWQKQEHERYRTALPPNRIRRLIPVLATAARGGYRRYGMGAQDALRDVVQPVD